MQIRRVKDGFASFDTDCLAYNEIEFDKLCENNRNVTKIALENIWKYDKTILIGQTREEQNHDDKILR